MDDHVAAALSTTLAAASEHLADDLVACWVSGSVAIGAFVPGRSDIDVVIIVARPQPDNTFHRIHAAAAESCELGGDIQILFVPRDETRTPWETSRGKLVDSTTVPPYANCPLTPTTRLLLVHHGAVLMGPSPSELLGPVDWTEVRREIGAHIVNLTRRDVDDYLHDHHVDTAVHLIGRGFATLEHREVVPKAHAYEQVRRRLPKWAWLADESEARLGRQQVLQPDSSERAKSVLALARASLVILDETWPRAT